MEKCPICDREMKNLGSHLRQAHNISKEDLEKETELTDNISEEKVTNTVVDNQVKVTKHTNKTMTETDRELKTLKKDREVAYEKAEKLLDQEVVKTHSVDIAEILVTEFGFVNVENLAPNPKKGIQKKTYVVKKI
jgi:hypothetical protein